MESQSQRPSLYPTIDTPNPVDAPSAPPSSSLYPSFDMKDMVSNLFTNDEDPNMYPPSAPNACAPSAPVESVEETIVEIQGAIVHLIDKQYSVELASGELTVVRLRHGDNILAVLLRVGDEENNGVQWPLAKDEASVKLDESHYFFNLKEPSFCEYKSSDDEDEDEKGKDGKEWKEGGGPALLNYGVTIASKGQEILLRHFDEVLEYYSSFSVQEVFSRENVESEVMHVREMGPGELEGDEKKREVMEEKSAAYWTTLAPNVEDYSGGVAKVIAKGSGQLIKGILWCGDVTVDRLKWGDEFLKKRMEPCKKDAEVSKETLKRIKRVKKVTKMSEKVAVGVLCGVVKVSGYVTSSVVNSKAGKKFFGLLPGEVMLASLDGFDKVCDAVEIAGKNVMSTSAVVTTGLVSHKHGGKAADATSQGMDAAGHAIGTAWAVFKIRKAFNPKSVIQPSKLAKAASKDIRSKQKSNEKSKEKAEEKFKSKE